jgi:pSer/pThr/pTyr-binding forkhead associated (FHA) protein
MPPPLAPPGGARSAAPPPLPAPPGQRAAREAGVNGLPATSAQGGSLSLVYNGERFPITKDRFVIGRGKQSTDLTLKDPNVSRQHAVVELQNGVYFMVDLGSTNGVAHNGQRIARKPIADGDVFRICDHDLLFTYR